MGTSDKQDTFHQCCFLVPATVKDHGTTLIHQRRKVSCFSGAMYEDGRTRGLLLGDSGYPCLLYLTPIARPTTDNERHYNRSHIMTWNIIERLFGVLKQFLRQFACLHFGLRTKLSTRLIWIIVPCCVLHNITRRHREIHNVVELDDDHYIDDDIIDPNVLSSVYPRGNFVRHRLVQQLIWVHKIHS